MTTAMNRFFYASRSASANHAEAAFACENTNSAILMGAALAASILSILAVLGLLALSVLILAILGILVMVAGAWRLKDQKQRS